MPFCRISGEQFEISDAERNYCEQQSVPLPNLAPRERLRRILNFRASPYLYHGVCAISGKRIISPIPPDSGFKVYNSILESQLDATQYARPYDFRRGFFEQFEELLRVVPFSAHIGVAASNENCDFSHGASWSKNCYLCFRAQRAEDCLYSRYLRTAKDVVDCVWVVESELCYACSDISRCFDLAFSVNCRNCTSGRFLTDCVGCNDCFGCVGLVHASHCFLNEQLTPTEYNRRIAAIDLSRRSECEAWMMRVAALAQRGRRSYFEKCEDSTGNYLVECGRATECFFCHNVEDLEYCIGADKLKSSFFTVGMGAGSELLYCCEASGANGFDIRFSSNCVNGVQHIEYCSNVSNGSTHCFGSVGLRRNSYCVLNQEYSKSEYLDLVSRIKRQMIERGEYGEPFPPTLSPYSFNRSEANDFLPLDRQVAMSRGYRWQPDDPPELGDAADMPDGLGDVSESVLAKKFRCPVSGKLFALQKKELEFHCRLNLALPDTAPLVRLAERGRFLQLTPN
ncbi:MAG: hypothetical protein U0136_13435 [Bdellovibrionota bacterium]